MSTDAVDSISKEITDSIAALLIHRARKTKVAVIKGFEDELLSDINRFNSIDVGVTEFASALRLLSRLGIAVVGDSELTGAWVEISAPAARDAFDDSVTAGGQSALERRAKLQEMHPTIANYFRAGEGWISRVIASLQGSPRLANSLDYSDNGDRIQVPASDRLVRLGHNQISVIEDEADTFFEVVDSKWNEPNEPDETSLAIGKVRAGLELVRASILELDLFRMSIVAGLEMLVEKYKDHAIGAAAGNLLSLILKQVGIG